jgi:putrescine transport system substrate-binding protein
MRLSPALLSVLVLGAMLPNPAHAELPPLRFYNWIDYIGEDTLARFTAQTGIPVSYETYDNVADERSRVAAARSGLDLVVVSIQDLGEPETALRFEPLEKSKLPGLANIDPGLQALMARVDKGNRYGVNWLWGSTGLGFDRSAVRKALGEDAPLDSLDLVFKPGNMAKLQSCGVSFLDSPQEMFALALNYLGEDPNATDEATLRKALDLLKSVRPSVLEFESGEYFNHLANGELCVAVGWSGDVFLGIERGREVGRKGLEYTVPREGTALWFDMLAIPKNATNAEGAHRFIEFILQPEAISPVSIALSYANANRASWAGLPRSLAEDPSRFPPAAILSRSFVLAPRSQATKDLHARLWAELKGTP